MSRPYHTSFDQTRSPMTSPPTGTPSASLPAPALKTNLSRAKSKRWVEAKTVDYGGGGWGDDDDFDEDDDLFEDGGYGPSYGAEASNKANGQQRSSDDREDDAPVKLSDLGRPANGNVVPRVETRSPDLGIPLPPTPLEMEQQEQALRKNTFPYYNNSSPHQQSQGGGILQSFLPHIITSRSASPARGILRAQTMGVDKPLPMTSPISPTSPPPPPPPAKDKSVPSVGYYTPNSVSRASSAGRDSTPQPFGRGHGYSSMRPGVDQARHSSLSAVDYSPDSIDRPMPLPKDTPVGDKPHPPWQYSPSTQSDSPSPISPPPHPVINEPEHREIEQPQLHYDSPSGGEQYSPPPFKIGRAETAPLGTSWGSTSQGSVNQGQNSIPRRPTSRSSSHGNGQGMRYSGNYEMRGQSRSNRSSQGSQLRYSPGQRRDQPGSPRSSQGRQSPEDRHSQPGSLRSSQGRQSPEQTCNQPESNRGPQGHHSPLHQTYQGNEYVDEEYYAPQNTQQPQVQQQPPQQPLLTSRYQPTMSPRSVVSITLPLVTQFSPSPPPLSTADPRQRTIHPSDIYACISEEREKERRASDADNRARAARDSIGPTVGGGVSISHGTGLSIDSQRGHLSPDLPQSRNRGGERMPERRESNGSRPSSRHDMGPASRRHSRSGSRTHSRSSSRAEGSRPGSRQDIVRSPSPFPPPTTALPPIPLTTVPASPASPVYEANIDEMFAEHEKRQQEEKGVPSWSDDIISGYGGSEDVEVPYQQQQQQLPFDPSSFGVVQEPQSQQQPQSQVQLERDTVPMAYPPKISPQPQFKSHSGPERSPSGGFKSMVNNAFKRQDPNRPTPATPVSPISGENSVIPRGSSIDDAISPILPSGPFAPINRSGTAPLPQMSTSLPPHQLERSRTERIVRDESHIARSQYRRSVGAERSVPIVVPRLDTQGSRGEIAEVTPDTPAVIRKDGPPVWVSSQGGDTNEMERKDSTESQGSQESSERDQDGGGSPAGDYLDTFLGDLERAQTPKPLDDTPPSEQQTPPNEQQSYDSSTYGVESVPQPQFQGQQQPFGPENFGIAGAGYQGQHEGWQHQQLYGQEESGYEHEQREQQQRHFSPSSFGVVHTPQHQHQEKEFPQQPQYEQQQPPQQPRYEQQYEAPYEQHQQAQYEGQQRPQYELQQPQYEGQQHGHLPPAQYSDTDSMREGAGVIGLYDGDWTQEDTSPPPPPPVKSPRRPSAPNLQLPSSMSATSHRGSQSELPLPLPLPQRGSTTVRLIPPPVSIPDRSVPMERPEPTPASALDTPDDELLGMMIMRRQFLVKAQTGVSVMDGSEERGEGKGKETEGEEEGEIDEGGEEEEGKQEVEEQDGNEADDEGEEILTVEGYEMKESRSVGGPEPAEEVLGGGTSEIRVKSPTEGLEVIPQTRILGPESEGIEAITGPTKVIREEPPKKEGEDDGGMTPMQSDYARELLNQFSRPQTLMLKDTMPMPSGLLVMPPMPPKEEGEEEVPDVVDFSVKDNNTDDEGAKTRRDGLAVKEPDNCRYEGSVHVGRPRQYMDPRDAARLPNPEDRVAAYNQARQAIAETPTGLGDWIKYMMEENGGEQLLSLTLEAQSRPETPNGRNQQHFTPMAKQPSAESDHRTLHSGPSAGSSPVLQQQPSGVMKPDQTGQTNTNGGNGGVNITPTPSVTTGGSSGSNLVRDISHAPGVDKAVDRAKVFLSRFGGKKGKEGKEPKEHQYPTFMSSNPMLTQPGFQHQTRDSPSTSPMQGPVQGQTAGFQGHHRQSLQHQGPGSGPGLEVDRQQQQQQQQQRGQPQPPPPSPAQPAQNDLAQLVQRGQMLQQAPLLQQPRQPPMTSGYPPDQPLQNRPRSQPQPPHLTIPGTGYTQLRSVPGSGPPFQQIVNLADPPHQPISSTGPQNHPQPPQPPPPPPPPPESARSSPHSHITEENRPEPSSQTPPPAVSVSQSSAQQTQQFPKRSDSLYSRKRFQDSRPPSPVTQKPDRSDSHSSSAKEIHQRNMRSDSLYRQQQLQQVPKRSDSLTSAPSSTISDSVISSVSVHPHKAQGAFKSIPQKPSPPPPVGGRYAGERRGQTAFAPHEDEPEPEPEEPESPKPPQQAPAPMVRSVSDHAPPNDSGPDRMGVQRSQTYVGSHPGPYIGNEHQGFVQNQTPGAPPQLNMQDSGMTSDDEELYTPPPPRIQMQQPSPPRGPPTGGPSSQQKYQQSYQNGPPLQMGQAGFPQGPLGFGKGSQEHQTRKFSSAGQPGQGPPPIGSPVGLQGQQMGPIGQHIGLPGQHMGPTGQPIGAYQFAPGDPRGQFKGGPQFHHGPPFHPGQPISTGQQSEPGVGRTSSGLMKTLSGVSGKRYSTDSSHQPPNSAGSVQYAGSTTSSQERRRSNFFGNLMSKMDDSVKSPQQTQMQIPKSVSPEDPRMMEGVRRTSFMKNRKKEKKEKEKKEKEKKEKPEKSHKKGFSINVFSRTESILGKLTKSTSPSQAPVHQPPPQQFQPRQVQPSHQFIPQKPQPGTQQPGIQEQPKQNYNPWLGKYESTGQPPPRLNHGVYVENVNAQHSPQSPPLGRGNSPAGFPATPQVLAQQRSPIQQFVNQHSLPSQQGGQLQYEQVPIPQGYGRLLGEVGQGQSTQQPPQQIQEYRQGATNVDPRAGGPSVNRNPSQVSDHHSISPNLSRAGTHASWTHETTRSLSPTSEVGSQFGRQQSLREGSIPETPPVQLSPRSSFREGQGHENQRYQQPLPLPHSIAQVQNGTGEHERFPRSMPLPVSPPPMNTSYGPPPTQTRSVAPMSVLEETRPQATSSSPPPPPPKQRLVESKQGGADTKTFYDSGSSRLSSDALSLRVASPIPPATSALPEGKTPILSPAPKENEVAGEEYDFSTEKIAVNLDLHGETNKTRRKAGNESDEEFRMSATAYPGQTWEPYSGWD